MAVKILETKKNPLFRREEVRAVISHEGKPTPAREEILPSLITSLKSKKELILIDKIFSIRGKGESRLKVFVYSKAEDVPKERLSLIEKRAAKKKGRKSEGEETQPPAEDAGETQEGKQEKAKEEEKPAEEAPKEEGKAEGKKQPEEKKE